MFSPLQMQPEIVLRLASSAAMRALALQDMALPDMIKRHGVGLVVASIELSYEGPLDFFISGPIAIESSVMLRKDGRIVHFDSWLGAEGHRRIHLLTRTQAVKLSGGTALDAAPGAIDDSWRAGFADDEITRGPRTRVVRGLTRKRIAGAESLGGIRVPVHIGRSDCELADQWQFVRLPSLVAQARERLAFDVGGIVAKSGLGAPLRSFVAEWIRPMYFGDTGTIQLDGYRDEDGVFFAYKVFGPPVPGAPADSEPPLAALALECF